MIQNDAKCVSVGVWNSGQILVGIKRHSTQSLSEVQFLCRVQYNQKMQMLVYASVKTIRLDSTSHNPSKNMLLALIIATDIYMQCTVLANFLPYVESVLHVACVAIHQNKTTSSKATRLKQNTCLLLNHLRFFKPFFIGTKLFTCTLIKRKVQFRQGVLKIQLTSYFARKP